MNSPIKRRALAGILAVLFSGLADAQTTQSSSKFLRFLPDARGGGQLQTSIITYRNRAGQTVDLIAAVHIADASYYADLNQRFKQYDTVLYEMVKPRDMAPTARPTSRPGGITRPLGWVAFLQQGLKNMLELSYQLEEVDYSPANFVHADLDIDTFLDMQAARGESFMTLMFQQMMHEMAQEQPTSTVDVAGLLAALQSPDRAKQLKLVLAKEFNNMDAMLANFGGPDGTVIVTERNRQALKILRQRIDRGDKNVAIFYGAAHLNEMEKDLTGLMGFEQVGEPKWLKAWDMIGVTPATRPAAIAK